MSLFSPDLQKLSPTGNRGVVYWRCLITKGIKASLCLARTGMRLGEVLALEWGDIGFRGRFIEVWQNYVRGRITRPKNGKTWCADMSQQLTETLRHLLTQRETETLQRRWKDMPEWVF